VLLLDRVIDVAESWLGCRLHVRGLRQAKFLAPLEPGDAARIELALAGDLLDFSIRRGAATVAKGCLALDEADCT
jgi:3-hydroxymyristoyl/3-hydroxydecanoyl-(acyl carrier protein) dehydratase